MFKRFVLATAVLAACPLAQADTTLAYHHNSSGVAIAGSLCNLKAAAVRGYPVRVVRTLPDGSLQSEVIHTLRITGNVVSAWTEHIGVVASGSRWLISTSPWIAYLVLDTTGQLTFSKLTVGSGASQGYYNETAEMRWYVDAPTITGAGGTNSTC